MTHRRITALVGGAALLAALAVLLAPASAMASASQTKVVYAMTNATNNHIVIYARTRSGKLKLEGSVATGGMGTASTWARRAPSP